MKNKNSHHGFSSWLNQRISAFIMLIIGLAMLSFIAYLLLNVDSDISSWQHFMSSTIAKAVTQIFFLALIIHAFVGFKDIYLDYIKCSCGKLFLHVFSILFLIFSLIYSIDVIWLVGVKI